MKVLFLGAQDNPLVEWLREKGEKVIACDQRVDLNFVRKNDPDLILSYNSRFLLPKEIITYPRKKAVNLHISFLPWNRGADPNPWSHLEGTPTGVSIHLIDEGIDTGNLICQKRVSFGDSESLRTSYEKLQNEIQALFMENWKSIREGRYVVSPPPKEGSFHKKSDRERFVSCLGKESWDVPISVFKKRFFTAKINI